MMRSWLIVAFAVTLARSGSDGPPRNKELPCHLRDIVRFPVHGGEHATRP